MYLSHEIFRSGFGFQFGLMPYGEPWRIRRRLFRKHFSASNAPIYEVQGLKYVRRLLSQVLERPTNLMELVPQCVVFSFAEMRF